MPVKRTHKRWKMVRILESTHERLNQAIEEILSLAERGLIDDPGTRPEQINPLAKGFSLDQMINLLLDRRDAHKARARKSKEKKRGDER